MHPEMTPRFLRRPSSVVLSCALVAIACVAGPLVGGCMHKKPPKPISRYQPMPDKQVPPFLKGSVMELTDVTNTEPYLVNGYGLVANLDGTGDSTAPNAVRDYMTKEMAKHKFGSDLIPGMRELPPERVLRDPRFAIVRVDGYLPPGIRKGQHFDIAVAALPESNTTSLARGSLYQTDLRINGADPINPGGAVNIFARCQGPVFVNPAYAFERNPADPNARTSLRRGTVMDGGVAMVDRPVTLRLRRPQFSVTRRIERRIDERFQDVADVPKKGAGSTSYGVAEAMDEALVNCYVPVAFDRDWERFVGVITHLYLDNSPSFVASKSKELAAEAVKPDAPLADISYCWEGLGQNALPAMQHLVSSDKPDVAFAAARAAAFIGDPAAPQALIQMAATPGHPFRVNAIQTLGQLPNSQQINDMLRPLLNSDETLVRLAAYDVLVKHKDPTIFSKVIRDKFVLDIVRSSGPPVVYCSRRGIPRIAIMGERTGLAMPLVFAVMDGRLSISSSEDGKTLTIFYRPPPPPGGVQTQRGVNQLRPIRIASRPDLAEVVARLAGEGDDNPYGGGLNFNYAEIVSILSALSQRQQLSAVSRQGQQMPVAFVLQETSQFQEAISNAPPIPEGGRPQSDPPEKVGMAK